MTAPAVLVLRALGLGDLLTGVPALRAVRAAYPDHRVVLAAPAALRDLALLTGVVDDLVPTTGPGPVRWTEPVVVAVNLHGRGPQSTRALAALAPGKLVCHAQPGLPGPEWDGELHEVRRWCRLLWHFGIPADPADLALAPPPLPSPAPGAVLVHPGCAYPARQWPAERYAEVAGALAAAGHRVLVTGGAAEYPLAARVAAAAGLPPDAVLATRTTLTELAALVAQAALVVCGDTGVAHLATAYGTPSVVLFGPVPPRLWGPPPDRARHAVLWAGSTGDPFADRPDPGLLRLTTAEVVAAAEALLAPGSG